jgi:hypothetical protein
MPGLDEEVIVLDPDYAFAYAGLAWTHMADLWHGISKSPIESLGRAIELGETMWSLETCWLGRR